MSAAVKPDSQPVMISFGNSNGDTQKRKRGRPPLPVKRTKIRFPSAKWIPKKWRPEYEIIVSMYAAGMSRKAIIEKFYEFSGTLYTEQHITNICNTAEAQRILTGNIDHIRKRANDEISLKLTEIQKKAVERVSQVIENDNLFRESPFAVVDRAFKVLEMGVGKKETPQNNGTFGNTLISSALIMTPEAAQILADGTRKADEARRLYAEVRSESE